MRVRRFSGVDPAAGFELFVKRTRLNLQGRVLDIEALGEQPPKIDKDVVLIAALVRLHVGT